jgi:hypothetical protein
MIWQPITEEKLLLQIEEELSSMPEEALRKFESTRTSITTVRCKRSDQYGEEQLFIIARSGNKLLIFDDVEEEFGVADITSLGDAPLEYWEFFGSLKYALLGL